MSKTRDTGYLNNIIQYSSSSVSFVSGSTTLFNVNTSGDTKHGITGSNTHQFTGSLLVTGSVGINTTIPNGKFQTKVATDANFYLTSYNAGEVGVQFTNDANTLQCKAQLYASQFVFTGGNIGIGTSTPTPITSTALVTQISSSTAYSEIRLTNSSTTNGLLVGEYTTNAYISNIANGFLLFGTNNTQRMIINSTGEVGIGVTPTSGNAFWVKGSDSSSSNTSLVLQNSGGNNIMLARNDGVVTKPLQPAFRAGLNASYTPGATTTIVFNDTGNYGYNIGSNYSTSTGRFTAPTAGRYIFNVCVIWQSMTNGTSMDDAFTMRVNGAIAAYSWRRAVYVANDTGTAGYYTDFGTFSFNLSANDYVEVYNTKASVAVHGNPNYCWFSGYFLG